jgi:hypothetical protein
MAHSYQEFMETLGLGQAGCHRADASRRTLPPRPWPILPCGSWAAVAIPRDKNGEELQEAHNIAVDSPASVFKKLQHVLNRLQPGWLLLYNDEGPMPHKDARCSSELFRKEMISALKKT